MFRSNPRARWPWLFCAAVLLWAGVGVAKGRKQATAPADPCVDAPTASTCWAREPACEAKPGNWKPCRVDIRKCIATALRCSGGVWR